MAARRAVSARASHGGVRRILERNLRRPVAQAAAYAAAAAALVGVTAAGCVWTRGMVASTTQRVRSLSGEAAAVRLATSDSANSIARNSSGAVDDQCTNVRLFRAHRTVLHRTAMLLRTCSSHRHLHPASVLDPIRSDSDFSPRPLLAMSSAAAAPERRVYVSATLQCPVPREVAWKALLEKVRQMHLLRHACPDPTDPALRCTVRS